MINRSDKYRFYISTDEFNYITVNLVKPLNISGSKEDKLCDYKRECSEWEIKRYQNPFIYDQIIDKLKSPSTETRRILVRVELRDQWSTLTSVEFDGYVPIGAIKVDKDNGTISFKPEDNTLYSWWDEHKADKHDLVNEISGTNTIFYDTTTWVKEYWIDGSASPQHQGYEFVIVTYPNTIPEWTVGTAYIHDNPNYLNYGIGQWIIGGFKMWIPQDPNDPPVWGPIYYYCKTNHVSSMTTQPGVGAQWQTVWTGPVQYLWHLSSQEANLPFTIGGITAAQGNGIFEEGFPQPSGSYNAEATNHSENVYYLNIEGPATTCLNQTLTSEGNIKLSDAMNHMLAGSGLTFYSQFFSSATSPLTGSANRWANSFLAHKVYLKDEVTDETKGEVSLEILVGDICELCNCMWHIDTVNNLFIIEHVVYYQNGKQYTGSPVVYTDLTNKTLYPAVKYQTIEDPELNETDNNFSYGNDSPQKETFKMSDTIDNENELIYTSVFVKKGDLKKHSVDDITTDFKYVKDHGDKTSDEGYCLILTDVSSKIYLRDFKQGMSLTVFTDYPNGDAMWDNLIRDLWKFDRYFTKANVNLDAAATTFLSQKKTKVQREIKFPRKQSGAFNPQGLITTNMGDGEIKSFDINTDTDFIKVILLYAMG